MASDAPTRPAAVPKYEAVLEENLGHVGQKIRLADLMRGILALACLLFGYALLVAIIDLTMGGSDSWLATGIRLAASAILLILATLVGGLTVRRYVTSVNPYFAARQLEETIPNAKNSLVNWLDLRAKNLPAAIRQSVGQKAARDLEQADPELVVSPRDGWRLGAAAAVLFLGLLILFALVPRQFGSLMARAFLPLRGSALVNRTDITLLRPAGGNATVPAGVRVDFVAQIEGRVAVPNTPEAPALLYRYDPRDVFVRVPLDEDLEGKWGARLAADQVRTGLWYKVIAGDASTPEYQLTVAAQPFVSKFEAKYNYRPYRKVLPETIVFPNEEFHQPRLLAHRGTSVDFTIHTNTPIKSGTLDLEQGGRRTALLGQPLAGDASALTFTIPLEKTGSFRVLFETPDGVRNIDRNAYPIDVLEDGPPYVELLKPGKDIEAPANGTVLLAGLAIDDFGVTKLALGLHVLDRTGPRTLAPLPFQPKKPLRFDNGTYPTSVGYLDMLLLDEVKTKEGRAYHLDPGAELTYWLEATDNSDYPHRDGNVAKSKVFKIKIVPPSSDPARQQKERDDAKKQKQQHDDKQAKNQEKQNQERNEQGKKGEQQNQGAQPSPEDARKQQIQKEMEKTADKANDALAKNDQAQPKDGSQQPKDGSQQSPSPGDPKQDKQDGKQDPGQEGSTGKSGDAKDKGSQSESSNPMGDGKGGKGTPKDQKDQAGKDDRQKKSEAKAGSSADGDGKSKESKNQQAGDGGSEGATNTKPDPSGGNKKDASLQTQEAAKTGAGKDAKPAAKSEGPAQKKEGATSDRAKTEKADAPPMSNTKPGDPAKDQGTGQQAEDKKGPDPGKSGEAKSGKETTNSGTAKEGDAKKDAASATGDSQGKKGPPSREDVEKLKELLGKGGAEADDAAKELAKQGRDVTDPDLRKDIEDTLKKAGRDDAVNELNRADERLPMPEKSDSTASGEPMKGDTPPGGPKGQAAGAGKEPSKGSNDPSRTQGGATYADDIKPLTADDAFRRRLGNLQLENIEDVKKRVTKDVRDKAGISEAEWQRFLRNAEEYQRLTRNPRKRDDSKDLRKGGPGQLGGTGPRAVQSAPGAGTDPLSVDRAAPPAEFQDAQRRFTRKDVP